MTVASTALSVKAKFHYTSWFGAGSKLVRSQIPLRYLIRTSFEPTSNQLRTSSESASVMEFGFKQAPRKAYRHHALNDVVAIAFSQLAFPLPESHLMSVCPSPHSHTTTQIRMQLGGMVGVPSSCALLGGFAIGARVSLVFISLLFLFIGSVRQIKVAIRQLLGARKCSISYRSVYRALMMMTDLSQTSETNRLKMSR